MGHSLIIARDRVAWSTGQSSAYKIIGAQSDDVRADDFLMVLAPILRNDR
jgi:hypothetical protein